MNQPRNLPREPQIDRSRAGAARSAVPQTAAPTSSIHLGSPHTAYEQLETGRGHTFAPSRCISGISDVVPLADGTTSFPWDSPHQEEWDPEAMAIFLSPPYQMFLEGQHDQSPLSAQFDSSPSPSTKTASSWPFQRIVQTQMSLSQSDCPQNSYLDETAQQIKSFSPRVEIRPDDGLTKMGTSKEEKQHQRIIRSYPRKRMHSSSSSRSTRDETMGQDPVSSSSDPSRQTLRHSSSCSLLPQRLQSPGVSGWTIDHEGSQQTGIRLTGSSPNVLGKRSRVIDAEDSDDELPPSSPLLYSARALSERRRINPRAQDEVLKKRRRNAETRMFEAGQVDTGRDGGNGAAGAETHNIGASDQLEYVRNNALLNFLVSSCTTPK